MKIESFPDEYDIREVIKYYTMPYPGVKRFLQGHGILFASRGKELIAGFAQNVILEYQDYRELQTLALSGGAGHSISGFSLSSEDWLAEGTDGLFKDIDEERSKQITQGSGNESLAAQPHFEELGRTAGRISGRLDYQRISPGKVELLNKSPGSVEFQIEPLGDRLWQVTCFPEANKDVLMLQEIFAGIASRVYHTKAPAIEPLEVPKRIEFYDTLLRTDLEDWQFDEVLGIIVRQPEEHEPILIEDREELSGAEVEDDLSERQPTPSDLQGITQAILRGRRLRTNSFVKNCEKQGFYFPSMTIQYRHKRNPEVMNLTVRFKLKPQMFEIILEETFSVQELERLEPCTFEWQRQQEILHTFWNVCNRILDQLADKPDIGDPQPFLPKIFNEGSATEQSDDPVQ